MRRLSRAFGLYRYGQRIVSLPGATSPQRARRLWRAALRAMDPTEVGSLSIPNGEATIAEIQELRARVANRLAHSSPLGRLRVALDHERRRIRLIWTTLSLLTTLILLVAAIPPLRWWAFPPDLAAGMQWRVTSTIDGFGMTGVVSDNGTTLAMFHTNEEPSPALIIDLGVQRSIHKVRVVNRLDCCQQRTIPLAVELSTDNVTWRRVAYRRVDFQKWSALFSRSSARYVRLRVDRISILHLQTVSIF